MLNDHIAVEKIVDDLIRISTSLRVGDGIDFPLINRLIEELNEYAKKNSEEDHVPKIMAEAFLDTFPSIESFASHYDDSIAQNIRQASDMIGIAIREVLS